MNPEIPEKVFSFGPTHWTAFGVLVALAIAVGGPLVKWLRRICWRPKLSIAWANANHFNSELGGHFWMRLPITNKKGRDDATNVEVFAEEIQMISAEETRIHPGAPMRMTWCHTGQPLYSRIPGDSFRLLDLGHFRTEGAPTSIYFSLGGEVHNPIENITVFDIPVGARVKIKLSISADGIPLKHHSLVMERPDNGLMNDRLIVVQE